MIRIHHERFSAGFNEEQNQTLLHEIGHMMDYEYHCIDGFYRLYQEGANAPRMRSVGLHTRIIGRPARIGGLETLLDHMAAHDGVWFATRSEIAHAWRNGLGLPVWSPRPCPAHFEAPEQGASGR